MSSDEDSGWKGRKQVRVEGTAYDIRQSSSGELEVRIDGQWRAQNLFRVQDDDSLQCVVEIMIHRYRSKS